VNDPIPRRFYRIVLSNPPTRYDFTSNHERGVQPRRPLTRRDEDRWRGLSVYWSFEAACRHSQDSPWLGAYVAEIVLPGDDSVRVEQTGRNQAHFTIWAEADDLLTWVTSVREAEDVS
jgi:hypothetical protein